MRRSSNTETPTEWVSRYCAMYLKNLLYEKHGMDNRSCISIQNVCYDGRRYPTAFKALEDAGVRSECYNDLTPKHDAILKTYLQYAKEPLFDTSKVTVRARYGGEDISKNQYELYKNIEDFTAEEFLHIYFYQSKFDFVKHEIMLESNNRFSQTLRKRIELRCFPVNKTDQLNLSIYLSKLYKYVDRHIDFAITHSLPIEKTTLISDGKSCGDYDDSFRTFKWTEQEMDERINAAKNTILRAQQAEKDLLKFRAEVNKLGGIEAYRVSLRKSITAYLTENAALYINSEDEDLKEIVKMLLTLPCLHQ